MQIKLANSGGQVRHTYLCIRVPLDCTPAITTDLADEHVEHDERAGPGQVRHDGAVHDGQAPAPASSSNGACDRPSLLLPHVQHMEGVQQARDEQLTSSSSSAAVGETAARLAIEPRSPHGRHGERERRGQLLRPAASRRVLTCYVSLRAKIETDVALGLIEVGYEEAGRASTVPVAALACAARQAARAGAPPPAAPP